MVILYINIKIRQMKWLTLILWEKKPLLVMTPFVCHDKKWPHKCHSMPLHSMPREYTISYAPFHSIPKCLYYTLIGIHSNTQGAPRDKSPRAHWITSNIYIILIPVPFCCRRGGEYQMYRKSHTHTRMPHTKNNIILVPVLMLLFLFVPISWCVCMFYLIFMNILLYSSPPVLFFV